MKLNQLFDTASSGSVGASSISTSPTRFFDDPISRKVDTEVPKKPKKRKKSKLRKVEINEAEEVDTDEMIARMRNYENTAKNDITKHNIDIFGLEDDEGNLIKIYINKSDSESFSKELDNYLDQADNSNIEIPEIIFNLKNQFNIIDVVWPTYGEDEEESTVSDDTIGTEDGGETDGEEGESENDSEITSDGEEDMGDEASAENDPQTILNNIIKMMTANAEATKAEARAKEAQYNAINADSNIKKAEEMADMDDYFKKKAESAKDEATLKKLVQYRSDVKRGIV